MPDLIVTMIVGSLRKESYNLKLAKALMKLGQSKFTARLARLDDLPLFNQDLEHEFPLPAMRLKSEIEEADGVLIVTPEYNRSIPAPLKNAIDWASRPYGKNAFARKPIGTIGASPGSIGTACAQYCLRPILSYLDARPMGQPEAYIQFKEGLIDVEGNIGDDKARKFLQNYIDKFVEWIKSVHS